MENLLLTLHGGFSVGLRECNCSCPFALGTAAKIVECSDVFFFKRMGNF